MGDYEPDIEMDRMNENPEYDVDDVGGARGGQTDEFINQDTSFTNTEDTPGSFENLRVKENFYTKLKRLGYQIDLDAP